jgi:hypothetical protein
MTKRKRWGNKYKDRRNWKKENAKLIKRGEFYINPAFLDTWIDEIKEMNTGKVGQPYLYPDSQIEFLGILYSRGFDYRSLQGITQALSKKLGNFPIISFSQIRKRIRKLPANFSAKKNSLITGIDGSGIKVGRRGEWIRHKWKIKKGWIKVVILGDTGGNVVDIRIGNEILDERSAGRGMLRKNKKNIKKVIMDGWHDCEDTFDLCTELDIEPVIKVRKNASESGMGTRPDEIRLYKGIGFKKWSKSKGYGMRWPSTEGIFSGTKGMFGESVRSHKKRNMYREVRLKFWAYQKIKNLA